MKLVKRLFVSGVIVVLLLSHCFLFDSDRDDESEIFDNWLEWAQSGIDTTAYYVSTTGDDSAPGTSIAQAFRTVAKALQTVKAGGTVRILPGTYNEAIGLLNAGNGQDTIRITGFNGRPVFDGQNSETFSIFCEECDGLIFENLEIRNYTDFGIGASLSKNMTYRNLLVYENGHKVQLIDWEMEGYGIHVDESSDIVIESGEYYRNGPEPQVIPERIMGTGINTYDIRNCIIRNNKSHHNIGGGILVEDSENVLVENNEVYANDLDATVDEWWDGGLWLDGGHDVIVRNNLFYDNLGPGIEISDEDNQSPYGYVLEGNVSRNNYYGIFIWNFGTSDWPDSTIIKNVNNQFINNTRRDVWIVATDDYTSVLKH
ncbi:right-handed parallel beta-helix repeat-containing protein [bacterium]|nr:right-handed parallel beta-helix repeat-containing protein [bacterium]